VVPEVKLAGSWYTNDQLVTPVGAGGRNKDKPLESEDAGFTWFPLKSSGLGVFAPLVGALVFKTSGRLEESRQWVRFPYTPV
jgi:hypothetical protein